MTGFRVSNIYMSVRKTAISRAPLKRTARSETAHHHSHHSLDTCAAADGVFHKRFTASGGRYRCAIGLGFRQ